MLKVIHLKAFGESIVTLKSKFAHQTITLVGLSKNIEKESLPKEEPITNFKIIFKSQSHLTLASSKSLTDSNNSVLLSTEPACEESKNDLKTSDQSNSYTSTIFDSYCNNNENYMDIMEDTQMDVVENEASNSNFYMNNKKSL